MNLKSAYREVGFRCKHLMNKKISKNPKDLFCLEKAIEKRDGMDYVVRLNNQIHIEEVIANKNITKYYYSNEIVEDKKYLGLMLLGIRFLEMTACFEDIPEAQQIFDNKLQEEIRETMDINKPKPDREKER